MKGIFEENFGTGFLKDKPMGIFLNSIYQDLNTYTKGYDEIKESAENYGASQNDLQTIDYIIEQFIEINNRVEEFIANTKNRADEVGIKQLLLEQDYMVIAGSEYVAGIAVQEAKDMLIIIAPINNVEAMVEAMFAAKITQLEELEDKISKYLENIKEFQEGMQL